VSIQLFGIALLIGAGAIALWIDVRFPQLAPPDLRRALFRTLVVLVASRVLFPPLWETALARTPVLVAVFAVALPCLIAVLLSSIWSMRLLQAVLRRPY
jgi:hypothetical protein